MVELTERVAPTFRSSFAEPSIELRLDEAVALATAWAASLGDAAGIRVLILKGDALAQMGLRQPRVSADVDVLIEPSRFDDYCALLTSAGWTERELPFISSRVSPHSITYVSHGWPCDIDVHSYFPGFLNDPQQVFHELWGRSQQLSFARFKVRVPDRISSILIAALHSLRDGAVSTRSASDLSELLSTDLTDAERTELSDIARRTGCDGSLEAFLSELGLDVSPHPLASAERVEITSRIGIPRRVPLDHAVAIEPLARSADDRGQGDLANRHRHTARTSDRAASLLADSGGTGEAARTRRTRTAAVGSGSAKPNMSRPVTSR